MQARVGGAEVTLRQPLQYRLIDPARGEIRRNVEVVPALSLSFDAQMELVPLDTRGSPHPVTVVIQNNSTGHQEGVLGLSLPAGWTTSPAEPRFSLEGKGDRATLSVTVTPARGAAPAQYPLVATAVDNGVSFDQSLRTIAYSHIQTHRIYEQARMTFSVLDLKVAPVRVGYIMGSGDKVPDALRRMGLDVTLLDEAALTTGNLDRYDTIVVGINASTARPEFAAALPRLYEFARRGGALVVQYQHPEYVQRNLVPFPAEMASRVTDETATVNILVPSHPVFTTPNRIGPADFDGWVQERNLYAFTKFDPRYTALLESHDPGEPPQTGGEVYAAMGKGHYVYTSYAWFRQLPPVCPALTGVREPREPGGAAEVSRVAAGAAGRRELHLDPEPGLRGPRSTAKAVPDPVSRAAVARQQERRHIGVLRGADLRGKGGGAGGTLQVADRREGEPQELRGHPGDGGTEVVRAGEQQVGGDPAPVVVVLRCHDEIPERPVCAGCRSNPAPSACVGLFVHRLAGEPDHEVGLEIGAEQPSPARRRRGRQPARRQHRPPGR